MMDRNHYIALKATLELFAGVYSKNYKEDFVKLFLKIFNEHYSEITYSDSDDKSLTP